MQDLNARSAYPTFTGLSLDEEGTLGYFFGDDVSSLVDHMIHWGGYPAREYGYAADIEFEKVYPWDHYRIHCAWHIDRVSPPVVEDQD